MYHSSAIINPRNMEVVLQCFLFSKLIKELRFQNKLKMQTIIQNLKSSLKKLFQRYFFNIILFFEYFSCLVLCIGARALLSFPASPSRTFRLLRAPH